MVFYNRLLSSVLLAILYASYSNAAARPATYSTQNVKDLGNGVKIQMFHPPSNYSTFGEGFDTPSTFSDAPIENKTVSFVASQLKVDSGKVSFKSGYANENGESFGYAQQVHNGVPIANAVANVAFKNNKVVAFGQSFVDTSKAADSKPSVDVSTVIPKVEQTLQGKKNDIEPTVKYLAQQDGSVALVHAFQVENDEAGTFYEAFADAHTGELLSVTDFVAQASYRVVPIFKLDIKEGLELLTNPALTSASPQGWHYAKGVNTTDTSGNNVITYKGATTATTKQSSSGLVFDYTYSPGVGPTEGANLDASRTNAFYLINAYHDTLYQYGFTESKFNFQLDNLGKGGAGNDPVLVSVQDAAGTNNANFATPPDGQSGRCRMYIFTLTNPNRDGTLSNDIVIHEMTHGLSNRLVGGGTATCLQALESRALGEGWSDAVADWFVHSDSPQITDFVFVPWLFNNPRGARSKPYSTSMTTNGYTYADIGQMNEEHYMGEVWANILHNVYAQLVGTRGFSTTARTSASGTQGNIVFLQLLVDSLALSPCNPTFISARNAFIQADINRYGGANKCLLWRVFASRGMGFSAANYANAFDVPAGC
ncbi:hypothetical protein E1B28_005477 [Marasmius oreades]|uniref:Extracellular metalloproteinase n=1 Tax=Marasmius oreades TaxID=181124 RepID=A0A9P7UW57_9AGAR|nr:uncharacterized protein E1B28_005477 [Marasmius oreades]KAG7094654.1 hypothetical protein E1B28_005477 [Marasmius oreades]